MIYILSIAMDVHPIPSSVLCVNSTWYKTLAPILHSHIHLASHLQLYSFSRTAKLCRPPKRFSLILSGGPVHFIGRARDLTPESPYDTEDGSEIRIRVMERILDAGGIWGCLRSAFLLCPDCEIVTLRLHSFISDPHLDLITAALSVIK